MPGKPDLRLFTPISLLLTLLSATSLPGQIVLQMEKYGSPKTTKFEVGDELTYRLYDDKLWYDAEIYNLRADEQIVVFDNRYVRIGQVRALRSYAPQRWSKPLGRNLYLFGAAWTVYSLGAAAFDDSDPFTWGDVAVTSTAAATGFLIQQLFKHRTYRMGKKRRLRVLDLNVK